jgi:hypothetical protein
MLGEAISDPVTVKKTKFAAWPWKRVEYRHRRRDDEPVALGGN